MVTYNMIKIKLTKQIFQNSKFKIKLTFSVSAQN